MKKKMVAALLAGMVLLTSMTGCAYERTSGKQTEQTVPVTQKQEPSKQEEKQTEVKTPKYIFMFIGDGMSYPQIQMTNYYLNAKEDEGQAQKVKVEDTEKTVLTSQNKLTMMDFPITGSAQTYDRTSFAPDSASTATSLATGEKTWSGSINVSVDFKEHYETIAEKLKKQKNYKVGIISSVNLNHATPAAFYAHQNSRNNYYEIGQELIDSQFDYFAGGGLKRVTGNDEKQKDLYELAKENGYKVVKTQEEAKQVTKNDGKVIVIDEHLADGDAMSYEIDRNESEWALEDYVEKGIEVLENETGFFMMVEGGKIDWACHANDAATTISETIAFDRSVQKAVEFYKKHPEETLIIVTGDHETGGLTIGYAGTNYDTFLTNLMKQKISYAKFDSNYVTKYKEKKTPFSQVEKDIEQLFGLKAPTKKEDTKEVKDSADVHPESQEDGTLTMTEYEYTRLKEAYETTMKRTGEEAEYGQKEYVMYGSYEPLTVTITHILNNKSGINFGSYSHTGLPVEVLVKGVGEEKFHGYYDNTDIYHTLAKLTGVK